MKNNLPFIVIIILLVLFLVTTYLSIIDFGQTVEKSILSSMLNFRFSILDSIMKFISSFSDGLSAVITFVVFTTVLYIRGFKKEFTISFLIWFGPLLSYGLKAVIARPRPEEFLIEGYILPNDFSFPSGHVVFYVVFFGLIAVYAKYLPGLTIIGRRILLTTSVALISLIGISRIYLGVHWPLDVISGYLLGFAILGAIIIYYFKSSGVRKG